MDAALTALVTGARGFIGKNLVVALRRRGVTVAEIDVDSTPADLDAAMAASRVVFHLAGVNRPDDDTEFVSGNVGSIEAVVEATERLRVRPAVVLSSSTQAAVDNAYGRSKLTAEQVLEAHAKRNGASVTIYRLPGVFGKWCRPNYNSVVATFCYNIARALPIKITDPANALELVYVDDVVAQFMTHLGEEPAGLRRAEVSPVFRTSLGELAKLIQGFRAMRTTLEFPDVGDPFTRRLIATYNSYIEPANLAYALEQRSDARGTFAELAKSPTFGQIFVSRTRPGVTRGDHFHDSKIEKFCVLEGDAIIRFRSILGTEVTEHRVSGSEFKVVDIPPGMTHSIQNVGATEMIVLFWASEVFDKSRPDTYFEEVLRV